MWARVKGRTENALFRLPFRKTYAIRPGLMQPSPGQRNVKGYYKILGALYPLLHRILPNQVSTMRDVGLAMIRCAMEGYAKPFWRFGISTPLREIGLAQARRKRVDELFCFALSNLIYG